MNFEGVEKIAAAILYEGYILYPYRATAIKNRQRWNFGTLYPRIYAEAQRPEEPFRLIAECLVVADGQARLDVRLSFLQLVRQKEAEDKLTDPSLAWDEAVERASEHSLHLRDLLNSPLSLTVENISRNGPRNCRSLGFARDDKGEGDASMESGCLTDGCWTDGVFHHQDLQIALTIGAQMLEDGACKIRLEVQNTTPLPSGAVAMREEALPLSLVSAHLVLGITNGEFVSLLDPAEAYRASAAACSNTGVFPVLAGEEPDRSMMLCSPIILYDYPKVAAESAGDFFDGTEMDEMLTLRVLTLTDAEKEEMRSGDPRARRILERTENLTEDAMLKAHGVIRGLREIRGDAS
jgi:hydrogenase maturation protease